eukprot:gene2036-2358_t
MRVGRSFAAKLDPEKPLFEEAGQLQLMPEELWPGAPGHKQQQQQPHTTDSDHKALSRAALADGGGYPAALQRLQQVSAEPDSDDSDTECNTVSECRLETASLSPRSSMTNITAVSPGPDAGPQQLGASCASAAEDNDDLSDGDSDVSASSLMAFDLQEDQAAEDWWSPDGLGLPEGKPLSLRAVAAALRKQDDADAVLDALRKVEVLVRAQPDELPVVGPELARSLLHSKVPVWASSLRSEATSSSGDGNSSSRRGDRHDVSCLSSSPEAQRLSALTAVLSLSPLTAGDTIIAELYSPHIDQYQRMLILDSLAAAAAEMAHPRRAPRLAAAGPGGVPKLLLPAEADVGNRRACLAPAAAAPAAAASGSSSRTYRNRFAPVAIRWASMLLQECDVRKHGIDLFGRDSLLLGRLLTVLGAFVEAAAATPAVVPLAAGLLELLKAEQVSGHLEVYVRRCGLVAASQVVRHLPPARLAGAMLWQTSDIHDQVLVGHLQWLMSWTKSVAAVDVDEQCRMLAAGCIAWHAELAGSAMAAIEHIPAAELPSLSRATAAAVPRTRVSQDIDIKLPHMERLAAQKEYRTALKRVEILQEEQVLSMSLVEVVERLRHLAGKCAMLLLHGGNDPNLWSIDLVLDQVCSSDGSALPQQSVVMTLLVWDHNRFAEILCLNLDTMETPCVMPTSHWRGVGQKLELSTQQVRTFAAMKAILARHYLSTHSQLKQTTDQQRDEETLLKHLRLLGLQQGIHTINCLSLRQLTISCAVSVLIAGEFDNGQK